ncbi:MAG TPA: TetR/AcrR family transcriptional regulator [Roseiarcus sp.]|nr:TetR/AcrR family transcriptional regulator [Roseiarcus sp.]
MTLAFPKRLPDEDRRIHILAAASRAFVRYGFHAATMTQVAEEAGMSAGNLYRYFPSKEAIVEGLCLADQVERSATFAALISAVDLKGALRAALREHVLRSPVEKARMIVEIWAESGRNARVAAFTRQLDSDVIEGMVELVEIAKARGAAAPTLDARFAASLLFSLVVGLFRRKALEPNFDVERESAMALGVFDALFAGALAPSAEV